MTRRLSASLRSDKHDDQRATGARTPPADHLAPDRWRLPRPTRWQAVGGVVVLLYLAACVGYAMGARRSGHPGRASVDVGFLYDMIAHHDQALTMANAELANGGDEKVTVFAREILREQSREMGLMEQKLAEWGYESDQPPANAMAWMGSPVESGGMPGMASDAELDALNGLHGPEADALFIPLMQDHHRGGVHMADYTAKNAETEWARQLAASMARNQRIEINELEQARLRAGLPTNPPAYVPAQMGDAGQPPSHH